MKKTFIILLSVLALASCAKQAASVTNEDSALYLTAWVKAQKEARPEFEWKETALGSYILMSTSTQGESAGTPDDHPFALIDCTVSNLEGSFTGTMNPEIFLWGKVDQNSDKTLARQLGKYKSNCYYGPRIVKRGQGSTTACLEEFISSMRVGERRFAIVPGWLRSSASYSTGDEFRANVTGTHAAYNVFLRGLIDDVDKYQLDAMKDYMAKYYPSKDFADSLQYGCYYIQLRAPSSSRDFPADTTIYVNYTGRLLDGTVFETTQADTAKRYGFYDSGKDYEPVQINRRTTDESITMSADATSVITGFAKTLYQMKAYEKGVGIFYAGLGYGATGSDPSIPPYAPIAFTFELTDKPETGSDSE